MRRIQSSPSVGFLTESQGRTPFTPSALDRKEYRALHSDGRPLPHGGLHTSPQPSNWGLALRPRPQTHSPIPPLTSVLPCHHPAAIEPQTPHSDTMSASSIPGCVTWFASSAGAAPGREIRVPQGANIPSGRAFCWGDFLWALMPAWNNYCCSTITGCDRWTQAGGGPPSIPMWLGGAALS
ncbi:hypothetical protein CgunFtcFv8_003431 [Champsocephalus gunnari]|uniref:Uncharacterized protein n=1 Tax=Champsocephalus gunnari TaxID=52237 RepID=A0AAN8DEE1_CHAGU|nr:hypothetical protein CgunFtcFv8_003431 [Champsocephalus gunnari]